MSASKGMKVKKVVKAAKKSATEQVKKVRWQEAFAEEVFRLLAPAGVKHGDVGLVYAICRTISLAENTFLQDVMPTWVDPYLARSGTHMPKITAYSPTHGNVVLGTATLEARVEARSGLAKRKKI